MFPSVFLVCVCALREARKICWQDMNSKILIFSSKFENGKKWKGIDITGIHILILVIDINISKRNGR